MGCCCSWSCLFILVPHCGWEVDTEIQESGWVAAVAGVAYLFWFPIVVGRWTQRYRRVGGLLL